jgi:hypothetical protein
MGILNTFKMNIGYIGISLVRSYASTILICLKHDNYKINLNEIGENTEKVAKISD